MKQKIDTDILTFVLCTSNIICLYIMEVGQCSAIQIFTQSPSKSVESVEYLVKKLGRKCFFMLFLSTPCTFLCSHFQVAIIAGNFDLAEIVKVHKASDVGKLTE